MRYYSVFIHVNVVYFVYAVFILYFNYVIGLNFKCEFYSFLMNSWFFLGSLYCIQ